MTWLCEVCNKREAYPIDDKFFSCEITKGVPGFCCLECWPTTYDYHHKQLEKEGAAKRREQQQLAQRIPSNDPRLVASIQDANRPIPRDVGSESQKDEFILNPDYTLSIKPK